MPTSESSTWFLARRLFLSGVAIVYALAFAELLVQVHGLFGSRGIAPIADILHQIGARVSGWDRLRFPSLLWWSASDWMLTGLCSAGVLLAALALAGIGPRLLLALCWVLYLSFVCVGSPF